MKRIFMIAVSLAVLALTGVIVALLYFTGAVNANSPSFMKTIGSPGDDYVWGNVVRQTSDGGFIVAGSTNGIGESCESSCDVLLIKLDGSISLALGLLSADRAIGATSVPLQQPPAEAEQVPPAAPSAAPSSKVWIGRYAEYEEFLRAAVIDRTTVTGTTQQVFFKPGGLAAGAALKRDSYKLEIAGYKLDRVLKLDMVPPTVEVRYNGNMASLSLWVLNTRMLKQLNERNLRAPDPVKWNYQLHRAYAFEDLVANLDENEGSPIVDPQWNLIVLDHSRAFTNTLAQPYEIGKKLNQIDRSFFDRIKALDKATVKRAIGDLVDAGALEALFARRDNIVKAFEKLAAQKGANQVFTP